MNRLNNRLKNVQALNIFLLKQKNCSKFKRKNTTKSIIKKCDSLIFTFF